MEDQRSKYENALHHVKQIREFYQHLAVYVTYLILWIVFNSRIISFILAKTENTDSEFLDWLHINSTLIPVLWGIGLLIHGLYVFRLKFSFFRNWEERKIQELMKDDNDVSNLNQWE